MTPGLSEIVARMRARGSLTAGALVAAVIGVGFSLLAPVATGDGIDAALGVGGEDTWVTGLISGLSPVATAAALLALAAVGRFLAQFVRRYLAGRLSLGIQYDLRTGILQALQRLDGPVQDRIATGQVVSRSISDLSVAQLFVARLPLIASDVLLLVFTVAVLVAISLPLAIVALLMLPVVALVTLASRRPVYASTWSAQQGEADAATHVEETITGVRVVKAFAQEPREISAMERLAGAVYALQMRAARVQARYLPVVNHLPQIALVVTIATGGLVALGGYISVGTFFTFALYMGNVTTVARRLSSMILRLLMALSALDRLADILALRPENEPPEEPAELPRNNSGTGLRLSGVTVAGESPDGENVPDALSGVDLEFPPGSTTAVVGPPGAGKSMLVLLTSGLYRPDEGRLELTGADGSTDYRDLGLGELRERVVCVFDDAFLYSASVRENIAMASGASDEEVRRVARIARADGFIEELADGYDTIVGERGLSLSGGQRQRVVLARALLHRPEVLVLDDATSAIDAATERAILTDLREELTNVTVVTVAHRESTVDFCDRAIVLDHGRVAAAGPLSEVAPTAEFRSIIAPADESARAERPSPAAGRGEAPGWEALWPHTPESAAGEAVDERLHLTARDGVGSLTPSKELQGDIDSLPAPDERPDETARRLSLATGRFRLAPMLGAVRGLIAAVAALLVVGVVADLIVPYLMRLAVDHGVAAGSAGVLGLVAAAGLGVVALSWLAERVRTVLSARAGERVLFGLRLRSYRHLQSLSMSYFDRTLSGRIMTRMTSDIDNLSTFLQTQLAEAVVSLGTLAGVVAMLVITAPQLALIALVAIPVIALLTWWFRSVTSEAYAAARQQQSTLNAAFHEHVAGLKTSQLYGREAMDRESFAAQAGRYFALRMRAQTAVSLFFPGVTGIAGLTSAVVLWVGAGLISNGELTPGVLMAFLMYLGLLYAPIQELGFVFDTWQRARVSFSRISDLLATEPTVPDEGDDPGAAEAAGKELAARGVAFRYREELDPVTTDLNVEIAPGETVAVVGPTGAGKSTLVKLIGRFYDPYRGAIEAGGVDVRSFPLSDWRARVAQVPQEAAIFSGTVAANIAYGKPGATRRELTDAVDRIGGLGVIAQVPGGFEHVVTEQGRSLSAGQRQVVALARAELTDAPVMLLDEATATLDPATEAQVLAASQAATGGRTAVVVAHRLLTAAGADRILVMRDGRVVEEGNHAELLELGGTYAEMWEAARQHS